MMKLNEKGMSIIELVLTFALVMIISAGLLTIIMNYKMKASIEMKRLELVSYKNILTKEIQDDIMKLGIVEINQVGACSSSGSTYSSCANLVFKNGTEKILAVSSIDINNKATLNNKYIKYGDTKYPIEDKLPDKIPTGRAPGDFQSIFVTADNFLSSDSTMLLNGTEIKIYSIDIYIEHIDYDDDFGIHIVATNSDLLSTNAEGKDFLYTGNVQEYIVPATGTYRIELWGASGGDFLPYIGGNGAYTSGYLHLNKNQSIYFYVGGVGSNVSSLGGYNGGGPLIAGQEAYGRSGGGATDVRLVSGSWNAFDSLKSRIMVAAGGGGANYRNITSNSDLTLYGSGNGGAGGGLTGMAGESVNYKATAGYNSFNSHGIGYGGTQISGGIFKSLNASDSLLSQTVTGGFGQTVQPFQSGAGGGWYTGANISHGGAGGGSSYISGHDGCKAINQGSTAASITHLTNSVYTGYTFTNTLMIDGEDYSWTNVRGNKVKMPTYKGKTNTDGNKGNGHARVTYLGL